MQSLEMLHGGQQAYTWPDAMRGYGVTAPEYQLAEEGTVTVIGRMRIGDAAGFHIVMTLE